MCDAEAAEYERLVMKSLTENLPRVSEYRDRTVESVQLRGKRPDTEVLVTYVESKGRHTESFNIWDPPKEFSAEDGFVEAPDGVASTIFVNLTET